MTLIASTPNIMFSVCLCARFQQKPREVHLIAFKHIFKHLIGTSNLGLLLKRREDFRLTSFCDAMLETKSKGKAQVGVAISLVGTWLHGYARRKV